jgi:hypothetical protein
MPESLDFINDTNAKVENVKSNTLFTIKNGKIIGEDYIDRSKRNQTDKLQINWEKQRAENDKKFLQKQIGYINYEQFDSWPEDEYNNYNYGDRNNNGKFINIAKSDKIKAKLYPQKNKVYFNVDGLYYLNGLPCDGTIEATPAGFVDISSVAKRMYYFISGVLMKSYFDYLCARQFIAQNFHNEDDCIEMYLAVYSPTPVPWIIEDSKGSKFIEFYSYSEKLKDTELFNGNFEPYFDFVKNIYTVKNGNITWHYEHVNDGSYYIMSLEQEALDKQILSGELSKNQIKKMIRKNLRETYARN